MSGQALAPAVALPIGQILYAIQDTTVIFQMPEPNHHATGHYRLNFSGSVQEPRATIDGWSRFPAFDDFQSARTVTLWGGKQALVLVTNKGLLVHSSKHSKTSLQVDSAVRVIGIDPFQTTNNFLAVMVSTSAGFAVVLVDIDTGVPGKLRRLPPGVQGRAVAAELVRRGSSTMLVIATEQQGTLRIHALDWKDLAPQVEANVVKTLTLGNILADPSPEVAVAVTSMRPGSISQQLAVAWPDTAGTAKIALVGWGAAGEATVLASATPPVSFAAPEKPVYRLTAADLLHSGTDRLVLGYPALYGNVKGCAALMMFTLDESSNLICSSKYVVSNTDGQPWANIDLHLAAGVFGTCIGLQIVGAGASLGELMSGLGYIRFGFVPVDINLGFPALAGDVPGVPCICMDAQTGKPAVIEIHPAAQRIFAVPSDLAGNSVTLGPPAPLIQRERCAQILAIIQAPPFQTGNKVMDTMPSVTFSTSNSVSSGCTVSSDSSWTTSDDVSVNLGLSDLSLSHSTHNSYLRNLASSKDDAFSSSVAFHANFTENDFLLVYETGYNIWRYPILRSSVKEQEGGEMLVVFPLETKVRQDWVPAHNYGYRPRSEVGRLLSYVSLKPGMYAADGYTEKNLLFKVFGLTVTQKSDTSSITFDQQNSTANTDSRHSSITNSVSDHLGLTARTELFDYLPISFGLNLSSSHSYSKTELKTTHLTLHSSLTIGVSGGTVKDPIYEYQITPYIYQHDQLGCLVLAWEVILTGRAWRGASEGGDPTLTEAQICLIRPVPQSKDLIYSSFSRSISFVEHQDGTADIVAEIFNSSLTPALDVACEFFLGKPESNKGDLKLPEHRLGKVKLDGELGALERRKAVLTGQKLTKPVSVSVQLFMDTIPCDIYWGIHPPEAFFGPL